MRNRGSALLLVPAGLLIVFVLAAIAVDYSHVYLARRELVTAADSAAHDAVIAASDGQRIDPAAATAIVNDSIESRGDDLHLVAPPQVEVVAGVELHVALTAEVEYVFAPALPGGARHATVTVVATARVR